MRIVEIRKQDAVALCESEWRSLQADCPQATPFQSWEWNEVWWRHFGQRKRPVLLLCYEGPTLVGLAPLYTSWHLGTPLRRLAWMGTGQSDYLGILALPAYTESVSAAFLTYLECGLDGWDIADLQQLRPDSALLSCQEPSALSRVPDTQAVIPMEPCPYLSLPATYDEMTRRLSKKMRSNLGYYERLVEKTFTQSHYFLADESTLTDGMTALFDLHQKRWNARWLPGVLGNGRVQAFHRDIAARFLERGWLRLHLLQIDGDLRSALYCFAYGGRTYYYLGGFAPELAKFSLGTLLTGRAIRQAIEEGHSEFDFLRGQEPYKYRWQPAERINSRLLLLRSRDTGGSYSELAGRAGLALNRVERYVEHQAKLFAEQQGRKTRPQDKEEAKGLPFLHALVRARRPRETKTPQD